MMSSPSRRPSSIPERRNSTKELTLEEKKKLHLIVSVLDIAAEDRQRRKFEAQCKLTAYFPDKDAAAKKEFDKRKLVAFFPELEQKQIRRSFRRNSLLRCYFPEYSTTKTPPPIRKSVKIIKDISGEVSSCSSSNECPKRMESDV